MKTETFTLEEFCTGAWSDRAEYASEDISIQYLLKLHQEKADYQGNFSSDQRMTVFLHSNDIRFEAFLYLIGTWDAEGKPLIAEPLLWVYGTTFDGVRECSGGQNHSGDLLEMAEGFRWLHEFLCDRWPRFREWYEPRA